MDSAVRNIFVRLVLSLCIAMQIAACLPHHHHGGSEAVCFDVAHCFDSCTAGCRSEHEHDCDGDCALKIDVAQFTSEDSYKSFFHSACLANDNFAVADIVPEFLPCACSLCADEKRHETAPIDIFACYLRRAIPARAPSLL